MVGPTKFSPLLFLAFVAAYLYIYIDEYVYVYVYIKIVTRHTTRTMRCGQCILHYLHGAYRRARTGCASATSWSLSMVGHRELSTCFVTSPRGQRRPSRSRSVTMNRWVGGGWDAMPINTSPFHGEWWWRYLISTGPRTASPTRTRRTDEGAVNHAGRKCWGHSLGDTSGVVISRQILVLDRLLTAGDTGRGCRHVQIAAGLVLPDTGRVSLDVCAGAQT